MTPERWQQIMTLFQAVLEQPTARQDAFLDQACESDAELRDRVKAMLDADAQSDDLLDRPAHAAAAKLIVSQQSEAQAETQAETLAGRRVGFYRIMREIGRGGMGAVYLARDTRLDRPVALKLLPKHLTGEAERVRRFEREAHSVSALNHPNILTIYDFGQQDGHHYIAAEYVEGRTLRALIGAPDFVLSQALDVAIQVASALSAAHQAGIMHRDIKPENIMLRPDGYVKVLDFGLAKLTESHSPPDEANTAASSKTGFETRSGVVLGTVNYMSPEQIRGRKLDARTDLFSLGVVLYELVTGRRPFEGPTRNHVLVGILDHEPPPLARYCPEAPEALQRIISRALAKDRAERHQTAQELLTDLQNLKAELVLSAQLRRHSGSNGAQPASQDGSAGIETRTQPALSKEADRPAPRTLWQINRGRVLLTALVLILGLAFGWWRWWGAGRHPFTQFLITKFTTAGNVYAGCISPDGKYVAYRQVDDNGDLVLWVKQVVGGGSTPVARLGKMGVSGLGFTPDGNFLFYAVADTTVSGRLYQVPVLGGMPRQLLTNISHIHNGAFSPDGRRFAFPRWNSLVTANADGSGEQVFATFPGRTRLWGCAWSPDGRKIVYAVRDYDRPDGNCFYLAERPAAGGQERMIVAPQRQRIKAPAWMPDGRGLLAIVEDEATGRDQLCYFSYPDGAKHRITRDANDYGYSSLVSVTQDAGKALLTQTERTTNLWVAPITDPAGARPLFPGVARYDSLDWTPDGKLIYNHYADGAMQLWLADADGGNTKQLTAEAGGNYFPSVSRDGRYIVFTSIRTGRRQVWRMDADGGNPIQLTTAGGAHPVISPDGRWVAYEVEEGGKWTTWRVPLQGGRAEQLTALPLSRPAFSPDGQWLAGDYQDPETKRDQVAIIPFGRQAADGEQLKVFDIWADYGAIRWTPDSRALIYIDGHAADHEIKLQPIAGGPPQSLLRLPHELIFWCAPSPDGKHLAYISGRLTSDLVLLSETN